MKPAGLLLLFLLSAVGSRITSGEEIPTFASSGGSIILYNESRQDELSFKVRHDSRIRDIQMIGERSGIAYTGEALFRTDDNGQNWRELRLNRTSNENVAAVLFKDRDNAVVILTDIKNVGITLAFSIDGGISWSRNVIGLRPGDLSDIYLENADLSEDADGGLDLTFRLATSSSFEGTIRFYSIDGGITWQVIERVISSRTNDEVVSRTSGNWSVVNDGTCISPKTGCLQEAKIYSSGKDITPPQIKELARIEKENARLEAEKAPMFSLPPGGSSRISLNRGFDKCTAAPASQMQTWWDNSPLYDSNIYISGRNRGCSQPQLTAAWVSQVSAMGWGLIPTIVGYQSPCSACTTCQKHNSDSSIAETQGRGEADIAITDATALGLTTGSILYYDMERYDETVSTPGCRTATSAFLKGWTDRVKELGYKSGVYGSPTNAVGDWLSIPIASRMDAIWMARWDNNPSVWSYASPSPAVPTDAWGNHQRIKQWQAPHNETWGGVTFNIDGNIADGPVAGLTIARNKNADFDGDGKSDVSAFRPDTGVWYYLFSSNGSASGVVFGAAGDIPVPGDYDGDGKTDVAGFRPADSVWHMLTKAGNYSSRQFGTSGDIPAAADFNGDGKTDIAVFRPSDGVWYIANSDSIGSYTYVQFGQSGDKPATGDYDGDGKADIAIFRPAGATGAEWWVLKSSGGVFATQFGTATDKAAPLDYTGDGKADIAFWRPSTGEWFILRSEDLSYYAFPFGTTGDVPAPGDFDGDGKADAAVFRPSDGIWYLLRSQAGFTAVQFGLANDRPVENAYLPQ